jgi:uncharacterized integral membrane protein
MSNDMRHTQDASNDRTAVPPQETNPSVTPDGGRVPRTRTGTAWFAICAGALLSIVLIIFMLQNTRGVRVHFLWMDGSLPLALALLIAAVGAAILTMVVGAARITQLRLLARRQRR